MMIKRNALTDLAAWFKSSQRKPLVLRGARQVGKTSLVRQFAQVHQLQCVELNFEKQPNLISIFQSNNPADILLQLEAHFFLQIDIQHTLLFLDEIQVVPELLAKLRWFAEDMPQLAVIAAGSLLDFVLADHTFSMPVGRINYVYLEPLSFDEFLCVTGKERLQKFLTEFTWQQSIPDVIHEQLLYLFKEYMTVGGMPAAVVSWKEERSLTRLNQIHQDLLTTYRDDFSKYAGKIATEHLQEVMLSIPQMLGEKFVYSRVNSDIASSRIKQVLKLLSYARVCHIVSCTAANGIPLGAETRSKNFKVIGLDVGLISAALGLKSLSLSTTSLVNQGGLSEQVVGQLLRTLEPFYIDAQLYYWVRQETGSAAEIDYVIQHEQHILPIEVKSGATGSLKSLHLFMALKKFPRAIRINANLPSKTAIKVKIHDGSVAEYELISLPFYLIGQLKRIL